MQEDKKVINWFRPQGKKVIIYGAASIAKMAVEWMENAGYEVVAFIDKRADEIIDFDGKPVYCIDNPKLDSMKSDKYFVFVCVKNVFLHSEIVNDLIKAGFNNIVYRPLSAINGVGSELDNAMNSIYDRVVQGHFYEIKKVPKSTRIEAYCIRDGCKIIENEDCVIARVPVDLVFTREKIIKGDLLWQNKPVVSLFPFVRFFRYMAAEDNGTVDEYIDYYKKTFPDSGGIVTESWVESMLLSRENVFYHMNNSWEMEPLFFARNAVRASLNNGQVLFNMESGKHRAAFLLSKKQRHIPLRITKGEYERYLNTEVSKDFLRVLSLNGVYDLRAPVPNPYFVHYPCRNSNFYYNVLMWLMDFVSIRMYKKTSSLEFCKISVFTDLYDLGFLERFFSSLGMKLYTKIDSKDSYCIEMLDRLFFSSVYDSIVDHMCNIKNRINLAVVDLLYCKDYSQIQYYYNILRNNTDCAVIFVQERVFDSINRDDTSWIKKGFSMLKDGEKVSVCYIDNGGEF